MNKIFEVQTWHYYNDDASEIGEEWGFDTEAEAYTKYCQIKVKKGGKILMVYESTEPDADGKVILEEWD
jgi:hypothetical protein